MTFRYRDGNTHTDYETLEEAQAAQKAQNGGWIVEVNCGCDGESRCSAHSIPINICNLANFILGREAVTGDDFAEASLAIMGGCKQCGASIACFNAYPAKDGYWRCGDCIGDYGYQSVEEALAGIFPEKCAHMVFCADCKTTYDQMGEKPTICGACGSDFIAVKFLPVTTAIRARRELPLAPSAGWLDFVNRFGPETEEA